MTTTADAHGHTHAHTRTPDSESWQFITTVLRLSAPGQEEKLKVSVDLKAPKAKRRNHSFNMAKHTYTTILNLLQNYTDAFSS